MRTCPTHCSPLPATSPRESLGAGAADAEGAASLDWGFFLRQPSLYVQYIFFLIKANVHKKENQNV